jgi:hypothetical protein
MTTAKIAKPKPGEPIKLTHRRDGSVRYKATVDGGRHAATVETAPGHEVVHRARR